MFRTAAVVAVPVFCLAFTTSALAQTNNPNKPTWWDKYQYLAANGAETCTGDAGFKVGPNVDVSNECGPQSETYITLDPARPKRLAGGSNEIFRLPMRGYFSGDGGATWGGVDLPLPVAKGNGVNFGSDPTLAFDSSGNVFYGYIVVYVGNGNGINGSAVAVARSTDGGRTYPQFTVFSVEGGSGHFNDKPMITADANPASRFRDSVYIAWDAATGGSSGGGVRLARSTDHGATFTTVRVDDPGGPGRAIGAIPFVGPNGEVYVAWNDYAANTIAFNRSLDGGVTWGRQGVIAAKNLPFDIAIPAEFSRGALVYPACDTDRSAGAHRGRLYCSWMDTTPAGNTDIFWSSSDDGGRTYRILKRVERTAGPNGQNASALEASPRNQGTVQAAAALPANLSHPFWDVSQRFQDAIRHETDAISGIDARFRHPSHVNSCLPSPPPHRQVSNTNASS